MSTSSKWSFFSGFTTGTLPPPPYMTHAPPTSSFSILLAQIIFGNNYKARSSSLCTITQFHALYVHKVLRNPTQTQHVRHKQRRTVLQQLTSLSYQTLFLFSLLLYCYSCAQPPSRRTTPCRPSTTCSTYCQPRAICYPKMSPPSYSPDSNMNSSQCV